MHFKDIVFVMEDVDAASKVVLRRKHITAMGKNDASGSNKGDFLMPDTSSSSTSMKSRTKGDDESVGDGDDKDDDGKKASMGRNSRGGNSSGKEDSNEVSTVLVLVNLA